MNGAGTAFLVWIRMESPSSPSAPAVNRMLPGLRVDRTTARASPLNAFRLCNMNESWSAGSPLSTPMIVPSPSMENRILLSAVGTMYPSPSTSSTRIWTTSLASASISCLSADKRMAEAFPVVRISSTISFPFILPTAVRVPGSYGTSHER